MRKLMMLSLLQIVLFGTTACAQKDFQHFYNTHRNDPGVECFELSTSLFRLLFKHAEPANNAPKNIERINIFATESANATMRRTLYNHLPGRLYKDLANMQQEGSRVSFRIRESREGIEELIMIADEDNSLFVISIQGFLSFEEAEALAGDINADDFR